MIVPARQVANVSRRSFFLTSRYFILAAIYNTQIIRGIPVFTPLPMGEGWGGGGGGGGGVPLAGVLDSVFVGVLNSVLVVTLFVCAHFSITYGR